MASNSSMLILCLLTLLVLSNQGQTEGSLRPDECPGRCAVRCSASQYKEQCLSYCQTCCAKCLCVPPGTSGNKKSCPCYEGGPNCP